MKQVGDLKFGCMVNGATHQNTNIPDIATKVKMVKEAGGFDYFDRSPPDADVPARGPGNRAAGPAG